MKKVKALVVAGYGLNCEEDTKYAFDIAGGESDIVHVNDLIENPNRLNEYSILAFPGGFSYGDDTGSGNAFAYKVKNHLWEDVEKFVTADKLVIGICNGFQILANLGLVPALNKKYGDRQIALLHNDSARYTDRWVDLKITSSSPWFKDIKALMVPIAHGEGKFFADEKTLSEIKKKKLIAARYIKGEICSYQNLPSNPNGSLDDIAAITDETGRVLGLMPHPERAVAFTHLPHWQLIKEQCLRENKPLPTEGPGLQVFKNAVSYFTGK
jgi:phosphoribosylformylglycinamidine synthase subunit PurQ / glutaminase